MERRLTQAEMTEIAVDFLLEQMDRAAQENDYDRVVKIATKIDSMIEKLDGDTIHLTLH